MNVGKPNYLYVTDVNGRRDVRDKYESLPFDRRYEGVERD